MRGLKALIHLLFGSLFSSESSKTTPGFLRVGSKHAALLTVISIS